MVILATFLGFGGVTWQWVQTEIARRSESHLRQLADVAANQAQTARQDEQQQRRNNKTNVYNPRSTVETAQVTKITRIVYFFCYSSFI